MAEPRSSTILIAGGGSGGHISPGLAIAERLFELTDDAARCVFVCSDRPIDAHMLSAAGARFETIPARPPSAHPVRFARFLGAFRRSVARCRAILRDSGAGQVLALGGFVAAPAVAAARAERVPVTLLNLDDPPGRANRWIARRADRVWTAIALPGRPGFAERVVGLPIRRQALAPAAAGAEDSRRVCRERLSLDPGRPTLFVTGASQGAGSINAFMAALVRGDAAPFAGWQIYHLAGRGADPEIRAAYAECGITATTLPFLDEIGLAWGAADLAVSRAGANSVAEAAANAVPTLFLPYPYHRDCHQRNNARPVADLGGAVIVDDRIDAAANATALGPVLFDLMNDEPRRRVMRLTLQRHRSADAARTIAELLLG